MIGRIVTTVVLALALCEPSEAAFASATGCTEHVEIGQAGAKCLKSGTETSAYIAGHSGHTYSIRPACAVGGQALCADPATCSIEAHDGLLFNVYQDADPEPLAWQACLTDQEAQHLGGLTPGLVRRAFRRLTWPSSELVVQPPNGRTLVNFDTNFFTLNTRPTTRVVTLLGQRVTIEATPARYVWHFGDTEELITTDPGAPYPDLRVTHRYRRVGSLSPSVDTTYAGRYRVGNGAWQTIPDTLTVPGATVALEVLSATPHLVAY